MLDSTPTPETWDLWRDGAHAPALNMALDEALLEAAPGRGRPLLRLYEWDRPAVTIGYVQTFAAAPATGYTVIRRPTGGGVVFHDADCTYTVVIPAGHWLAAVERLACYRWVNRAVLAGLGHCRVDGSLAGEDLPRGVDRSTMVCFHSPTRYDVMAGARKLAGSAQRRTAAGVLHQGSIHFGGPLPIPRPTLYAVLETGFADVLSARFAPFTPDAALRDHAERLADGKYATAAWNRRR